MKASVFPEKDSVIATKTMLSTRRNKVYGIAGEAP